MKTNLKKIMYINLQNISINLSTGVKHITRTAAMALSGTIENGLCLTATDSNVIIIYNDRIDFGRSYNPEVSNCSGLIFPNFYVEYGRVVYRFGSNLKCSFFSKTIDYVGILAPTVPDNDALFNLIYPKFA